mmetsp:Transcript_16062/g.49077  ORF Transcript_16062/g.49077 Transcript_16062/m.49077 type:complete len:236 (-) Transcript_16062:425-1132(-)
MTPAPGAMCPSSSASSSSSKPYSSSTLSSSLNAAISKSLSSFLPFPFGCPSSPPAASAGGSFMSSWLSAHRKPEAAQAPRMSRMPVKEFGRPESSSPAAHIMTPSTTTTMLQMSNVLGFSRRKSSAKKSVKAGTVPLSIVYTLTVRWSSAAFDAATSKAVQKAMGTIPLGARAGRRVARWLALASGLSRGGRAQARAWDQAGMGRVGERPERCAWGPGYKAATLLTRGTAAARWA